MLAICPDFISAGPRNHAARVALRTFAYVVVVGVEQISEGIAEGLVSGRMRYQDESLEEPGRMRAMPFRGARLRTRLHHLVFGAERRSQSLGHRAGSTIAVHQRFARALARRL